MGKNCGAKQCTGASQTSPLPPGAPKTNRGSGSRRMDTASIDTIDASPSKLTSTRPSASGCPPGCDPGVTTCPTGISRSQSGSGPPKKPNTADSSNQSGVDDSFMNLLVDFMQRSYEVIKDYKENSGSKHYSMSHSERTEKIQELVTLIAEKEAELAALEAEHAAINNASSGSSSLLAPGMCHISCQADCSPYAPPPMMGYPQTPANSRVDYSGETERSVHDYTCSEECTGPDGFMDETSYGYQMPHSGFLSVPGSPEMIEDECQSECADVTGDMANTGFIDENICEPQCYESYSQNDTSIGDILTSGFMEYNPQPYAIQQYAQRPLAPRAATNSAMAGGSVSSCYCPPDGQAARYGRKR